MQSARDLSCPKKFARVNDLDRIRSTWVSLEGLGDLPIYVRTWIPYLTVVLKFGFDGIKAPIEALTGAHYRSNSRANRSVRSTYMALSWLEANGWISRRKLRLGYDRFSTTISLNREKFRFFLRRADVGPCRTEPHVSPQLHDLQNVDRTSTTPSSLRSIDSSATLAKSKPCAKSANNNSRPKHHQDPIRYSCFLALQDSPDKKQLLNRLDAELSSKTYRTTLDWSYWISRWTTMTHDERDFCAANDLLPALRSVVKVQPRSDHGGDTFTQKVALPPRAARLSEFSPKEQADLAKIQAFLYQGRENAKKD